MSPPQGSHHVVPSIDFQLALPSNCDAPYVGRGFELQTGPYGFGMRVCVWMSNAKLQIWIKCWLNLCQCLVDGLLMLAAVRCDAKTSKQVQC